ncbi:MAG: OmpA family protein [Candidatus Obscuribacterales bacterium]|nr:OmpA family protein [Steroidobacteraceae bacterium]
MSFSSDALFGFDQAAIRPEGRAELDNFATDVKKTQFDVITVEGHTDRLGSAAYNEKLSLQRAEVVKNYLVTTGGISAAKVVIAGKGESMPITKSEDCKGEKRTPQLITCLQPDRRVEVEVTATQVVPAPARAPTP